MKTQVNRHPRRIARHHPFASKVAGTFISGTLGDKIGRKYMCLVCYVILVVGITLEVIANTTAHPPAVFFVGKAVNGLGIGALQITGFVYISEYAVTGVGLALLPFVPETPTWLVMKGRIDAAMKAQRRMGTDEATSSRRIANIKHTLKKATEETARVTYAELFRKSNLRRTIVAFMPLTFKAWSGVFWVIGYFIYYAQLAGYSTAMSYKLNVTQQVLSTFANICSWSMIERRGRRFLTLWGMIGLTALLLAGGAAAATGTVAGNRATISLILVYCWYYNCTIGATSWVAASEIGTSRLRNKTTGSELAMQGALATFWNFVLHYMFNPNAGNLQGKVAFIFGATSVMTCIYTFFCHPKTKGRTFAEIDELFVKRVPARKFASYVTEAELRAKEVQAEVTGKPVDQPRGV